MTENYIKDNNCWIHKTNGNLQAVRLIQNTSRSPLKTSLTTIKVPITEIQNKIKTLKAVKVNVNSAPVANSEHLACSIVKREPIDPTEFEVSGHLELSENSQLDELDLIEVLDSRAAAEDYCISLAGQALSNYRLRVTNKDRPISKVMSYSARKRSSVDEPQQEYTTKRRRHADKVGKGLRHFSMKVCEKVRNKGFTSYNEVADELVTEFTSGIHGSTDSQHYDQKNIRRRVYDALNVLMAMNIISKEKKEIRWLGLPTNSMQECTTLEREKQNRIDRINKKTQQLEELLLQHISFKSLIERNKESENRGVKPSPSSAIHLPFIVVNTTDKALIDCSISNDKTEYMFNFNKKFQIHDDIDILKRMGLLHGLDQGECTEENIRRIKTMVPKSLEHYVEMMGRGNSLYFPDAVEDEEQEGDDDSEHPMLDEHFKVEIDTENDEENESSEEGSDVDV